MPSPFARAAQKAGRAMDRVFAERFELIPMSAPPAAGGAPRDVNARRTADASRAGFVFSGSYASIDEEYRAEGRRIAQNATRENVAPKPIIDVETSALLRPVLEGDRIRRLDTGEIFDVGQVSAEDTGRTRIRLIERQARAS